MLRLVRLLDSPGDIQIFSPLIVREILYRVLQDEQRAIVKQVFLSGSPAQRVAKIMDFISRNYTKPLSVMQLAKQAEMSVSSLHYNSKSLPL